MNKPRGQTRNRRPCVNVRSYFKQYCALTSIHGFQYFGEDRTCFERIWWVIVYVIILSCCSLMIYKICDKYNTSPVIVTFATRETPIYKIPFPAITICPETKSSKRKFNYTKLALKKLNNESITYTEEQYLQYLSILCDNQDEFTSLWDNNVTFTSDFFEALDEIKPNFLQNAHNCQFMGSSYHCEELFTPVMTDEGICYSFNILDRSHIFNDLVSHYKGYHMTSKNSTSWSMEKGYEENASLWTYPERALLAGATNGLTVDLATSKQDLDYKCNGIQGFKVVLHSPVRIPRLKQEYFRLPLDQAVVAAVQPVMITTSDEVKAFDPGKRYCYFPSERNLKYFKTYSQSNCQLECLTNVTLGVCDCVDSFMPRNNSTSICGTILNAECVQLVETYLQYIGMDFNFGNNPFAGMLSEQDMQLVEEMVKCDCMPLCTDLSYNTETSQTDWNWEFRHLNKMDKKMFHMSSLTVYFKFSHFITSERNELFGPIDLLASFGGLLGLFTGFSILSLMEIIYFLTVRICCNIKLYGRWTGTTQ